MRNGLILALDRTGCLQTARWSDVSSVRRRRLAQRQRASVVPMETEAPKVDNDWGLPEIRVHTDTIVCTGQSPPNDHPHVTLKVAKEVVCPYCGTKYRLARNAGTGSAVSVRR
jgi:uncharacterized Zn-finger protein